MKKDKIKNYMLNTKIEWTTNEEEERRQKRLERALTRAEQSIKFWQDEVEYLKEEMQRKIKTCFITKKH
jgi:hypothetical protein